MRILTPCGARLYFKLLAQPRNVFIILPSYCSYLLTDSQLALINAERLFIHLAFYGRDPSGNPIIQIRNSSIPLPSMQEMEAAGAVQV
jgi:hypothetical protein